MEKKCFFELPCTILSKEKKMFTIYIDRLKDGNELDISEIQPSQFLDIENDPEISSESPVEVKGSAYIAGDWLVLQASISTTVRISCALCNESFSYPIELKEWTHQETIDSIKGGIFSYQELIRQAILLEVPFFAQCGIDHCANYDEVKKFMVPSASPVEKSRGKKKKSNEIDDTQGYHPFKDLSWEGEE